MFERAVGIEVNDDIAGIEVLVLAQPPGPTDRSVAEIADTVIVVAINEVDMSADADFYVLVDVKQLLHIIEVLCDFGRTHLPLVHFCVESINHRAR